MLDVHYIFPTAIGKGFLNVDLAPIVEQTQRLKRDNDTVYKSNKNGWQSPALTGNMVKDLCDEFQLLVDMLLAKANFMASTAYNSERLGLSNFWFNVNGPNSYNAAHAHAGTVIAAVFYLQVPKNSGDIEFHRADGLQHLPMIPKGLAYNESSATCWRFEPVEKMYLMFPGTALHSVGLNQSNEERISIAFNFSAIT